MRTLFLVWFFSSIILLAVSAFMMHELPEQSGVLASLSAEPLQTTVSHDPITLDKQGRRYTVKPLFEYELRGLVVSHHDSMSWLDYAHKSWGDMLNVRDLCVIWGDNLQDQLYDSFSFKSGDFTCFFQTESGEAWSRFRQDQISNNHLLAGSAEIQRLIAQAETGDQVLFKGFLAEYGHDGGFTRGTSTSREDKGMGACETVFVTHFEVLRQGNPFWRTAWNVSLASLPLSLTFGVGLFLVSTFMPASRDPEVWHEKGLQLAMKGRLEKAEAAFSQALELDAQMEQAWQDRALVRDQMGRHAEAQSDRRTAERLALERQHLAGR